MNEFNYGPYRNWRSQEDLFRCPPQENGALRSATELINHSNNNNNDILPSLASCNLLVDF